MMVMVEIMQVILGLVGIYPLVNSVARLKMWPRAQDLQDIVSISKLQNFQKGSNVECQYYGRPYHTVDRCFEIIGFLVNSKTTMVVFSHILEGFKLIILLVFKAKLINLMLVRYCHDGFYIQQSTVLAG